LRVAHVTYAAGGGAGRAAKRAHEACLAGGIDSFFLAVRDTDAKKGELRLVSSAAEGSTELAIADALMKDLQWGYVGQSRTDETDSLFSIPYPALDLASLELIRSCDVIHLHWVSWAVSPRSVGKLLGTGKQVVWTLHDFWPMTGGCHYPADCRQFETSCGKCPQLKDTWQLVPNMFGEKATQYGGNDGLTVVTPSRWLGNEARSSRILGNCRIEVLPNALDTDVFKPSSSRDAMRMAFGIAPHDVLLTFGNDQNKEGRKGGAVLKEALAILAERWPKLQQEAGVGRLIMAVFGKGSTLLDGAGVATLPFDEITKDEDLADILSMADAYIHPAVQDNYPNTIIEAFACAVPAVGFPVGGLIDTISHGETGYLATKAGDPVALADTAETFVRQGFRNETMRAAARDFAVSTNSYRVSGARHIALYNDLAPEGANREATDRSVLSRATALLSTVVTPPSVELGDAARRFPLGLALSKTLRANRVRPFASDELPVAFDLMRAPSLPRPKKTTVLAVRTAHRHHSAFSGPYHFLGHLPKSEFHVEEMLSPLGEEFCPDQISQLKDAMAVSGAKGFANIGNAIVADLSVFREVASGRFDIVHFIDGDIAGWLAAACARRSALGGTTKFVSTLHQPESVLKDLVSIARLSKMDRVIALCEPQRKYIESLVAEDVVDLIPHGIHTDFFVPPASRDPSSDGVKTPLRLVAVGAWLRDYETLFRAMHLLDARGVQVELDIVGGPASAPSSLKAVRLHRGIDDEALRDMYAQADALCLPLMDATANNALLESMACGLPIVITGIGGTTECASEDCAIFTQPGDPSSVASAVTALASDPDLRRRMGAAARARSLAFNWARIGDMHADVYRSLVRDKG
jgi:glycosyltransferase involved in cell wall biosynthesis